MRWVNDGAINSDEECQRKMRSVLDIFEESRVGAGDGGSCFSSKEGRKGVGGAVVRKEGYPRTGSGPVLIFLASELRLALERSQLHLQSGSLFPVLLSC